MKTKSLFVVGSAIVTAGAAALVAVTKIKRHHKEASSASYEEELASISANHDAEMAALRNEEDKIEKEHQKELDEIQLKHDEIMGEIAKIREEVLTNMELRKTATPEEAKRLNERDMELLQKLRELK